MISRYFIFRSCLFIGLMILGLGLFRAQVFEGRHYRKLSEQNRIRLIPVEATRGRVFDKNGKLLASNRASYDVIATPEDITPEVFSRLVNLLNLSEKEIRHRVSAPREYPFAPAVMKEDVPRELVFKIEELKPELPGVLIRVTSLRYYPYKETASHLIGYIGKISPEEFKSADRERFGMSSYVGRAGIERIYDDSLRGWRGGRQIEVDARGEMIRVISEKLAKSGEDVQLSIDLDFQQKIMEMLKDKRASVAVLDLKTNGLLALASAPGFDPNIFVSPSQTQERVGLLTDRQSPLLDRGVSSAYPPGSVFKLVTAIAGLETGKITPHTRVHCPGYFRLKPGARPFHCWHEAGHGSLNLYEALERSCNVYFYKLGKRLSPEEIARYARILGFGEKMTIETTRIEPGLVPDSEWKKIKLHEKWYQGETLSFAIGQGYLLVSPLQVLRLVSIIAKQGEKVEPSLLLGSHVSNAKDKVAIKEENMKAIRQGMLQVVESNKGTGQLARVNFAKMAAKTGTAQAPPKTAHSWMTGFFPYEDPQIAFVVFVEHGGPGGITAAKIVKDTLQIWNDLYAAKVV